MSRRLVAAGLLVAAVIHLLPVSGVLGAAQLERLYGITVDGPDLAILLRHRAVLFGVLGVFLAAAAFRPAWQPAALAAGFASVVSFLALALAAPEYNAALARVFAADLIAFGGLCVALLARWMAQRNESSPA